MNHMQTVRTLIKVIRIWKLSDNIGAQIPLKESMESFFLTMQKHTSMLNT